MDFKQHLTERGGTLLGDGAWGTFLYDLGLKPGDCPDAWCLSRPEDVRAVASAYIQAGSDCVETNSFGASSIKLQDYGLGHKAREINLRAAELSRSAAGPDRYVLASIGPTGKLLMMGDVSEEEMHDSFAEQALALTEGGADALCIETMSDLREAEIALQAARSVSSLPLICTFTYEKTAKNEFRSMMGILPEEAVRMSLNSGAAVVGSNCGNGISDMLALAEYLRSLFPDAHLMFQANAGLPKHQNGKQVYTEDAAFMASFIPALRALKTSIIGGCCGTGPEHIRAFRQALDQ